MKHLCNARNDNEFCRTIPLRSMGASPARDLDYQLPHAKRQRGSVHALNAKHLPPRSCFCVVRAPSPGAPKATMAGCPDRCRLARDRRVDERLTITSLVGERAGCDLALRTALPTI